MQHKQDLGSISAAWTQNKLCDMNWADSNTCKCCEAEGAEEHRLYHCKTWREERHRMPDGARTCEMRARSSKEDWRWQRGLMSYPASDGEVDIVVLGQKVDGFRNHTAIGGSLRAGFRK